MTNGFKVKIPKGTLIDIDNKSYLLKKSIHAQSDGEKIILTGDKITTELLTIERRDMSSTSLPRISSNTPMPDVKPPRVEKDIPKDLHKTAIKIVMDENIKPNTKLKRNAIKYLDILFEKAVGEPEKEKPKEPEKKEPKPTESIEKEK